MSTMSIQMKKPSSSVSYRGSGEYVCKTCQRRFDTFQALGGHQGTHRRVKPINNIDADGCLLNLDGAKALVLHRCKKCMKEFETGQALGGHMRRHRLENALILMEKERLVQEKVVEKEVSDLVMAAKELQRMKSVGLQRLKVDEDRQHEMKTELVLAAQEWRLCV